MPAAILHLQKELGITHLSIIAYNGGLVVDSDIVLHTNIQTTKRIAEFCKNTQIHVSLYHNNEWFFPEMDYWAK